MTNNGVRLGNMCWIYQKSNGLLKNVMGGKLDWSEHINRQTVIFTNYTLQESVKGPRKRMGMGGGGGARETISNTTKRKTVQ